MKPEGGEYRKPQNAPAKNIGKNGQRGGQNSAQKPAQKSAQKPTQKGNAKKVCAANIKNTPKSNKSQTIAQKPTPKTPNFKKGGPKGK